PAERFSDGGRTDWNWSMRFFAVNSSSKRFWPGLCLMFIAVGAAAQPGARPMREFPPGRLGRIEELPAGRFRTRLDALPAEARGRALRRLQSFHFTELDLETLEADSDGGIYYVDHFPPIPAPAVNGAAPISSDAATAQAPVPVNPF